MKKLEISQMENLQGGKKDCTNEALGFLSGAVLGGTLAGGPAGFMAGGLIGVIGMTFISIAKTC